MNSQDLKQKLETVKLMDRVELEKFAMQVSLSSIDLDSRSKLLNAIDDRKEALKTISPMAIMANVDSDDNDSYYQG